MEERAELTFGKDDAKKLHSLSQSTIKLDLKT
jgi:hypothetical protein